jgi:hypothetical protein
MKRITDSDFVYTNSVSTDLKRTFAKARLRIKREAYQRKQETENKVQTITRRTGR